MTISIPYQIPFHDVDSMNIVWHGHYYKYFELARTELYRTCRLDMADLQHLGFAFPVIESHCRYYRPLRYAQRIHIMARFKEWKNYILIRYSIHDAVSDQRIASGHTKQAVCDSAGNLLYPVPETVIDAIAD